MFIGSYELSLKILNFNLILMTVLTWMKDSYFKDPGL